MPVTVITKFCIYLDTEMKVQTPSQGSEDHKLGKLLFFFKFIL